MTQNERREYLIHTLLRERGEENAPIPRDDYSQKRILRSLMNVRMPAPAGEDFLRVQDAYLQQAIAGKGVTKLNDLTPIEGDLYLWQGDITTLACGAIVNAANSQMLGCFVPMHSCIDNCIHTYAGIELRNACGEIMRRQGHEEPTGQAKITPAYNLPCDYVLHTVGPIVSGRLTDGDCELLKSSYLSCLKLAEDNQVKSVAFCCISTGVFGFPKKEAAQIAVKTVRDYKAQTSSDIKVIFNVFSDEDWQIYRQIFAQKESIHEA